MAAMPVPGNARLDHVLEAIATTPARAATVVDAERRVVGTITLSDIVSSYRSALETSLRRLPDVVADSGLLDLVGRGRATDG
jgi:CBS-domain-containing membrane protein